ncbi:hypothetical protein CEP88_17900 [Roseobacter denitrificans]|uniref:Uncharacterized protein n=1 Tax=Roseobacter denitrificans (strain ATCC 33942 / OCh 114) TaxID=375451 RepID=Q169V4_ROSDO|nr:hypothetical protein [Roseobacter denitrificans]ABG31239.1 hypothetical protein RD1_1612 [Roseobacter denitrificans OCh 114]AVL54287.1 hypothetical protein CEP88_17900 [Roseobacter denitrificans]SFF98387.1 hypothetical protein SAMN05443635_10564 [Roseobacter denitrificans OCh 114]
MIRLALIPAAVVALLPMPLTAQGSLKVGMQNMRLAMEICLRKYRSEETLRQGFAQAGFALRQSHDADVLDFDAPGVSGGFRTSGPEGYCHMASGDVPLALAEEMGLKLAQMLFPGMVTQGHPERDMNQPVAPCDGLSIFAPQTLIRVTYSAAGNSGDCLNDGTSAIAIQM